MSFPSEDVSVFAGESANSETAILDHDNLRQYDSTTLFTPSGMAPRYG